jgi:hypothetical protein
MEISPIAGIVSLPVIKAPPPDITLVVVSDVENTARIGDETYTPSDGESAGDDAEDEFDESASEDQPETEDQPEAEVQPSRKAIPLEERAVQVSFFA